MSPEISPVSPSGAHQIASARISLPTLQQQPAVAPASTQPAALPATNDKRLAKAANNDTVAIDTAKVAQQERLQRIEDTVSEKTNLATRVRQTDTALDSAGSHVQAMKANLAKIVKNYPPFAIDSKERMEILRSYISLRKEIDSMSIPPVPSQQGIELTGKIWKGDGLASVLPDQLATNSSDAQVKNAHDQLGSAEQAISSGKQELKQNVLAIR
jgi:hypothetical protein